MGGHRASSYGSWHTVTACIKLSLNCHSVHRMWPLANAVVNMLSALVGCSTALQSMRDMLHDCAECTDLILSGSCLRHDHV
jgi:hypothetical protein